MGRVTLHRESFASVIDEALPLLSRHYHEVAHYQDIPLNIDRERYFALENAGLLRVYTARVEGRSLGGAIVRSLVGYAVFVVDRNLHYAESLQAKQDVIYVAPEHRGTRTGLKLITFSEGELRREGVQVVYHHVKLDHPTLGDMLHRLCGYEPIETIFGKRLDTGEAAHPAQEIKTVGGHAGLVAPGEE